MSQSTLGEQSGVRAEWPPPYLLEGDAWTFLGLARTRRLRALLPEGKPLSILGWSPVVLQALRYSVACSLPTGREMAYSEIALTAVSSRTPRKLLPLALLVDQPIAHELGRGMGFPKARG